MRNLRGQFLGKTPTRKKGVWRGRRAAEINLTGIHTLRGGPVRHVEQEFAGGAGKIRRRAFPFFRGMRALLGNLFNGWGTQKACLGVRHRRKAYRSMKC